MKSLTSRTTLITAVAVAGVLIAGTAAIAANIGILNASNDTSIGSLSATDDLLPSTTLVAGVPIVLEIATPTTTQAPTTTGAGSATYVVDDAGTVTVTTTAGGLGLVDAAANPGWTPAATQPDAMSLRVAFDNGTRTVVFTATLSADGTVVADLTEPVIVAGAPSRPVAPTTTVGTSHSDDDDRYEDDDDDSHEYEGADDDD